MNDYKKNLTEYRQQYFSDWQIPKGYHVHHIKPRCTFEDKGDPAIDHPRNLIALHPDDHSIVHKLRGDKWVASMILSVKDRVVTDEIKEKIRKKRAKQTFSDETRAKFVAAGKKRVGNKNHMYGKKHKLESIEQMIKNRSGEKHPAVIGHYITPWGKFLTAGEASEASEYKLNHTSLRRWCRRNNDKKIRNQSYLQCKYLNDLGETVVGKTFKELGFGYWRFLSRVANVNS